MSAFILVQARLSDPEKFQAYVQAVPPIVEKYGGHYRIVAGEIETLEGEWWGRTVVMSEWPNAAAARAFWNSREYVDAKALRVGTGEFLVLLIEGLQLNTLESE